jgi:hypothetical protein
MRHKLVSPPVSSHFSFFLPSTKFRTQVLKEMQPDLIPIPAERTEIFSLCGRCAASGIEDAQRVVKRFTPHCGRLQNHVPFA